MKKLFTLLLILALSLTLFACGEKKTLHCDGCGKELQVDADNNMEEDWLVFCDECGEPQVSDGSAG